jgi:hypothetical protein|tara:strand:- start:2190 stop:2642 length:453 start_codon:yes stop_codon:yes gene_type:complete
MARPRFETSEDIANEERFIETISNSNGESPKKLPPQYSLDYLMLNNYNRPMRFMELKQRNNRHDQYDTYIISLKKILNGQALSKSLGVPFELAVRFTDGDYVCTISDQQPSNIYQIRWMERHNNRDGYDGEPVVHIPMWNFSKIDDTYWQ